MTDEAKELSAAEIARIYSLRTMANAALAMFENHAPKASEIIARQHVETVSFLCDCIERLLARSKMDGEK